MGSYYTYAWLREDRTPYYIGKGKNGRAWRKGSPPKERVLLLKHNLSEKEAFRHETYMIYVFGRKDIGTGILRNLTNGGEGVSGHFWEHTEEWRQKVRASMLGKNKGKKHTQEFRELKRKQALGRSQSPESNRKRSEALRGIKRSPESIAKSIAAHKGQKRKKETVEKIIKAKRKRFQCLETGFISNDTGLTKFQRRRGIDPSLRVEVA